MGGSCRGGVGHVGVKWGGPYRGGVGHAGMGSRNDKGVEPHHVYDIT